MDVQLNESQQQIFDDYSSNIINADQLENPTPDLDLPTGQTQDFSSILGTSFQTTPQEQQNINTLQTQNDDIFSGLLGAMGGTQDRGARTLSAEEEAGIPTLQTELTDITNQINQTSLDFRRERERIQTEAGLTEGQRNARLRDVSRKQASQLADLEVIRMARSNSLENAQSIVQRKLQLQFADEDARIQNLQFVYGEVKENLTKAEDRQFQKMMKREEAELDIAKGEYERLQSSLVDLANNVIQRGGSSQQADAILKSNSLGQALGIAGNKAINIDTLIKNRQLDKLAAEIRETEQRINPPSVAGSSNDFLTKIVNSARNKGDLSQSEREQLSKMGLVITQLDTLESSISKSNKTGVIKGRVNNLIANLGANADAGYINAQIQALIPNVARGIYGEVGVLTDADIENYKKTLPNIKTIEAQNELVLAMTLRNAMKSYENILNTAANSGIDVSGWAQDYGELKTQVFEIEDRIGVSEVKVNNFVAENPGLRTMVEELISAGASDREILQILQIE